MDHMEYSIALPPHVELTNAGAEWTAMKHRHFNHLNPNPTSFHQPSPSNLFTSFLISISFNQVQDVFNMLGLSVEEALRFNKILKSFEDLCLPRFLIIYNRYRFFMCKQNGPEFNGFLQQLLAWSDLCEFGELKDILLKDSIIRGISEESVRQHLLRTEQLDFNKTVEICKAGLVKHYATDNTRNNENKVADAWTETCVDIVENNNSVFKALMVDKAVGNSVVAVEKQTQTDLSLNNESFSIGCEKENAGLVQETKQKEISNLSTMECRNNTAYAHDLHHENISGTPGQMEKINNSVKDTNLEHIVCNHLLEGHCVETEIDSESRITSSEKSCVLTDIGRSLRHTKKEVEDLYSKCGDKQLKDHAVDNKCNTVKNKESYAARSLKDNHHQQEQPTQALNSNENNMVKLRSDCNKNDNATNDSGVSEKGDNAIHHQRSMCTDLIVSEKNFKCKYCPLAFETKADLKGHIHVHSQDHPFVCNICSYRYANASTLKIHKRSHTSEKPYTCPECNKSFKWSASLYRHKRIHSCDRPYKCKHEKCDCTFPDLTSLQRHANKHTNNRPYKCACGSSFADSWALRIHKRVHSGERPYHCSVCKAAFTRPQHLKDHQKLHTGEKPFECEFCHAKFIEASKLKSHLRKHTGERPYLCKTCGKTFTWSAAYKRHMKTHTLEKPYICKDCGNAFADNTTLVRHKRTHTGEKPYHCDHCLSKFADSSSLSRHRQIHSTEKGFTCGICSASFAVKAYLTRHLRTHSEEKPYQCNLCGAKFGDSSKLNRHKKIHSRTFCQNDVQQQKKQVEPPNQQQLESEQLLQQQNVQKQPQQLHNHQNLQQQQQLLEVEADAGKSSFVLWHETQEVVTPSTLTSAILAVNMTNNINEPLLLPSNTSSDFPSTSHNHHTQDDQDMSQYLSSQLLEFDDNDNPHLHRHEPHQHHYLQHLSPSENGLSNIPDQSFIEDIPDHVVNSSVLDDILNIESQ